MANPQLENGHTDIAHEVLEGLMKAKLTGTQWDLVMVVIRRTWGWHIKQDRISLSQFQKLTGRNRSLIGRELSVLQDRNIIKQIETPTFGKSAKWMFNKDWESWVYAPRGTVRAEGTVPPEEGRQSSRGEPRVSPRGEPTKDRRKETLKKISIVDRVFDHWISKKNLPKHKKLTPGMSEAINKRKKKGYSQADIFLVIDHYDELCGNGHAPGYGKWGIVELMTSVKYFDRLLDEDWEGFSNSGEKKDDAPEFF